MVREFHYYTDCNPQPHLAPLSLHSAAGNMSATAPGSCSEPSVSSLEAEDALKQASKFLAANDLTTDFSVLYSVLQGLTNFSRVFPSTSA